MSLLPPELVADVFVEAADSLVEDFDLVDFLYRFTERVTTLCSTSATGLLLADANGRLAYMAASDERTHLLELFQVQTDEGPCRDCYHDGRPVSVPDLGLLTPHQWPRFASHALGAGLRSVHAFPLRLRGDVIGVVGTFGDSAREFDPRLSRVVQALADVATIAILQERAIHRSEILTGQLQAALDNRIAVEQAKGALVEIHGITMDEASALLGGYAQKQHVKLVEVAKAVVARPETVPELITRRPS